MVSAPLQPPIWIDTPGALSKAVKHLATAPRIAVDTESNSLFAYKEKVCLIQISSPHVDYIFDPLALPDLSSLGGLFNNPLQEKIFHASEYDLICLKRDYQFSFANIFDTMIAARILGIPQIGLGALLNSFFEVVLDKKYQRADWGLRPLPSEMLDYARLDTYYLFQLRDALQIELNNHGLSDLALEDFSAACNVKAHESDPNHNECWKVAGGNHIDGQQAAVLNELCKYRDDQARKADLPLFKVLSNDLLLAISAQRPTSIDELKAIPHCSEKVANRHGMGILKAVAKGENAQPVVRHKSIRPDDAFIDRVDRLKEMRKKTAKELKVESDIVLPRELMESIATHNPATSTDLKKIMLNMPVRYKKFGTLILEALKSEENQ